MRNHSKIPKIWIPLKPHRTLFLSLSCPLASPVDLCPSLIINLKQDVSRQLSSQSLLSLFCYRSVLCYRLSWLLSAIDVFASGKERNCLSLNLQRARFQMTYNHLTIKIDVVRQWHLYIDTVVESHRSDCSLMRSKDCIVSYMRHLRVIISVGNIYGHRGPVGLSHSHQGNSHLMKMV